MCVYCISGILNFFFGLNYCLLLVCIINLVFYYVVVKVFMCGEWKCVGNLIKVECRIIKFMKKGYVWKFVCYV